MKKAFSDQNRVDRDVKLHARIHRLPCSENCHENIHEQTTLHRWAIIVPLERSPLFQQTKPECILGQIDDFAPLAIEKGDFGELD